MNETKRGDLHVHSTRSDGSMTREEILFTAKRIGLTHVAFTEHDSTVYVAEGVELGKKYEIQVIPALEISAIHKGSGRKVHILGYDFQQTENIDKLCKPLLQERNKNCIKQIEILKEHGFYISKEQVQEYVHGESIYKQHIMAFLYETGQVKEMFGEFYQNTFKNGGMCDLDIDYISMEDAVKAITADRGIAVLAHPGQQQNFDVIESLIPCGLKGIELNHPANSHEDKKKIMELSEKYGLMLTGGSDFHGSFEVNGARLGSCLSMPNLLLGL